jgi:signal transduction histidine kinase
MTAALLAFVILVSVVDGPAEPTWIVVLFPLVGIVYLAVGCVAWLRRTNNHLGAVIVFGGLCWLAAALANTGSPALIAVGQIVSTVPLAVIVHLLLAFPSGSLRSRPSRLIVTAAYLTTTVLQSPFYLFTPEAPPFDPLEIAPRPDLVDVGASLQRVAGSVVMVATAVVLSRRIMAASRAQRRVLGPLYGYGSVAVLMVPLTPNVVQPLLGVSVFTSIVIQLVVLAMVPVALAFSILRGGFARTADLVELAAWLGIEPGGRPPVRDALADVLGDPSIRLAFWASDADGFVDAAGRGLDAAKQPGRSAVVIEHDRQLLSIVEYDGSLISDPEVVRAAGEVVALALERDQLTASLRATQDDLRRSRLRIIEAGDAERRRIARDLHDGLQNSLVLLGVHAARAGQPRLRAEVDGAVEELRSLVHGIVPPVLFERGLDAAVEDLADKVPIPVTINLPTRPIRLAPPVEQAGYFVVAEAVTNAVKHAQATTVQVHLVPHLDSLTIEIRDDGRGGASPSGTGLRGLADRVDALGGTFALDSPPGGGTTVRAVLPCGS